LVPKITDEGPSAQIPRWVWQQAMLTAPERVPAYPAPGPGQRVSGGLRPPASRTTCVASYNLTANAYVCCGPAEGAA
jgi:hypothetical protein